MDRLDEKADLNKAILNKNSLKNGHLDIQQQQQNGYKIDTMEESKIPDVKVSNIIGNLFKLILET